MTGFDPTRPAHANIPALRQTVLILLTGLWVLFGLAVDVRADAIRADAPPDYPLMLVETKSGMATIDTLLHDLDQYVIQRLDHKVNILTLPNARLHKYIRSRHDACSLGIARVPQFEDKYRWIRQSAISRVHLYTYMSGAKTTSETVLVNRGTAPEAIVKKTGWPYLAISSRPQIVQMLRHGRATRWLEQDFIIDMVQAEDPDLPLQSNMVVQETPFWIACSPGINSVFVRQLAHVWDQGIKTGELAYHYHNRNLQKFKPPAMISAGAPSPKVR